MRKIGLVSIIGNIVTSLKTQGGGYHAIVISMVKQEYKSDIVEINPPPSLWHELDVLLISEGVNYVEGQLNLMGGPQPIHKEKLEAILNFKGEIVFLNSRFDFNLLNKRVKIENAIFPEGTLQNIFNHHGRNSRKCVIGDSHALSVWRPGYSLDFTAGRTLHGFLKRNTPQEINEKYNEVILYFGCIDVRFHLMRQENPKQATIELFTKYIDFAKQLKNCTIATIIPVEHTSRKIPGTGLYKKKPFFGTRSERQELVEIANNIIKNSGLKCIIWPDEWNDSTGEKMLDILESRQSVHLKPKNYLYIKEILG